MDKKIKNGLVGLIGLGASLASNADVLKDSEREVQYKDYCIESIIDTNGVKYFDLNCDNQVDEILLPQKYDYLEKEQREDFLESSYEKGNYLLENYLNVLVSKGLENSYNNLINSNGIRNLYDSNEISRTQTQILLDQVTKSLSGYGKNYDRQRELENRKTYSEKIEDFFEKGPYGE